VVGLEAQLEQRGLDAREAAPQIFRRGEGEAEDEVRVVVFLSLELQTVVGPAGGG